MHCTKPAPAAPPKPATCVVGMTPQLQIPLRVTRRPRPRRFIAAARSSTPDLNPETPIEQRWGEEGSPAATAAAGHGQIHGTTTSLRIATRDGQ